MAINIIDALAVGSQLPLDDKLYFITLEQLSDLGSGNVNAYKYYEDMTVQCVETHEEYVWKESTEGLIESGFTYPEGVVTNGIDYGNRTFNFVIKQSASQGTTEFVAVLPNGHTLGKYSSGDTVPAFASLDEFAKGIGIDTIRPTIKQNKSLTLSGQTANVEVGTTISYTLGFNFVRGLIESKNGAADIPLVGEEIDVEPYSFSGPGVDPSTGEINTVATGGSAMRWDLTLSHKAGTGEYFDSNGDPDTNLDASRAAGTVTDSNGLQQKAYYYRYHYLGGRGTSPNDSATIRSLTKAFTNSNNEGSYTVNIPSGTSEFAIYIIEGKSLSIIDASTFSEMTDGVTPSVVSVDDAGGASVSYDKYIIDMGLNGFPGDTNFNITIS